MSNQTDRRIRALRARLLLTAIGGAAAGASRAIFSWILDHL
jgi:hypothetical protein